MNRRQLLKSTVIVGPSLIVSGLPKPAQAFVPPVLVALAGVMISVAFRRYVVTGVMSTLARWFPGLFATELRKYLMAVAVAFGFSQAKAVVVAEQAENIGAQDLARDGVTRATVLTIQNNREKPLKLTRLKLLLVDVGSRKIELILKDREGLVVPSKTSKEYAIACSRFPGTGLKQWYVADKKNTYAVSKPFMVVA